MSWMEVEGAGWRRVHGLAIPFFTITKRNKISPNFFVFAVIIMSLFCHGGLKMGGEMLTSSSKWAWKKHKYVF